MLIGHCHVASRGFGFEVERNPAMGTLPGLHHIMQALGIDQAVALAPFEPQEGMEPNLWLVEQLESYPEMIGFATINPIAADAVEQMKTSVRRGLVGLKLHPPAFRVALDDPNMEPYWQAAEEMRLPIAIHTGVHGWYLRRYLPILLDDVAERHPHLSLIIEHVGGAAMFDQALAVLQDKENCYAGLTQTSGRYGAYALWPQRLKLLLDTVGPDRIIYGVDYPWSEDNLGAVRDDIAWIRSWGLSAEDEGKILGGNLAQLVTRPR